MLIFKKIQEIQAYLNQIRAQNHTIGFVPTMGALHNGHISLIEKSKQECAVTLCSIFVNPTQFNDKKDLERYPRMPEKDIALLEKADCDAVFLPSVEEMYPITKTEYFDFAGLDLILEGKHRPGHFNGVGQVVKRFFEIINPNKAFFGSKDYQQVMIVKLLVKQMGAPIEIVACPILRERDGLAMSSRNALLNDEERAIAGKINKMVDAANNIASEKSIEEAKLFMQNEVLKVPLIKLDYFEICDAENLEPVSTVIRNFTYVSLLAVFVGKIRLIDNAIIK